MKIVEKYFTEVLEIKIIVVCLQCRNQLKLHTMKAYDVKRSSYSLEIIRTDRSAYNKMLAEIDQVKDAKFYEVTFGDNSHRKPRYFKKLSDALGAFQTGEQFTVYSFKDIVKHLPSIQRRGITIHPELTQEGQKFRTQYHSTYGIVIRTCESTQDAANVAAIVAILNSDIEPRITIQDIVTQNK